MQAVGALGYTPNVNAQMLASRSWSEVGLLLRAPQNPTYGSLYHWMQSSCSRLGMGLVTSTPSNVHEANETVALQRVVGTRPNGLLIATGSIDLEIVKSYARDLPTVVVPRPVDDPELNASSFDEVGGATAIAEAVLDHGHTRVAVATRPAERSRVEHLRTSTMIEVLRKNGADVQVLRYDAQPGAESFEDYEPNSDTRGHILEHQMKHDRTALMFANDVQAAIHIAHMIERGQEPGNELSITGMDGSQPWAAALGLATVHFPVREAAEAAVELLGRLLADPEAPSEHLVFPGTVQLGRTLAQA